MTDIAIRVENLGKEYHIGGKQERYTTLRDMLTDTFTAPLRRARNLLQGEAYGAAELHETIWALKDVSFEVKRGEVIGIIGRNGAGKSTLLKILSRITEPTTGFAEIYGRVGALLEVGTGFHQELTGRENIYLNGAILGMSRAEIDRKFDEIVDFSGVEKFIDTPVKHYSSGMGLRLGFSVAAHLEPEILVVDEVLAVGDAEFQKKCLGKMSEVAGEGRTVLFVSHNLGAVRALCSRGIVLERGTPLFDGAVGEALGAYQQIQQMPEPRNASDLFAFEEVRINGRPDFVVDFSQPLQLEFTLVVQQAVSAFRLMAPIFDTTRQRLIHIEATENEMPHLTRPGQYRLRLNLPALWLSPGPYMLELQYRPVGSPGLKIKYHSAYLLDGIVGENTPIWNPTLCPDHDWETLDPDIGR